MLNSQLHLLPQYNVIGILQHLEHSKLCSAHSRSLNLDTTQQLYGRKHSLLSLDHLLRAVI